jgi:hypothetical protein
MTARTLLAAEETGGAGGAGDALAGGEGRAALVDEGGADEVGAGEVLVTRGVTCDDAAVWVGSTGLVAAVSGGVDRVEVSAAPAAPLPAICVASAATARTTTAAASARNARRGADARERARWRGI